LFRLLLFLFFIFSSALSFAQKAEQSATIQGITIHADSFDRDTENETVDLIGNVQIIYQDQHMTCERAHINLRAKSIDASGNVLLTTSKANLAGQRVVMDYETNTGVILDGYVQSGNVLFEGSQINKLSEVDYVADDARYTTCTTCPEAWSFTGSRIRAEIGGYAYIKNSVMRFAGVPVFWMPYLAVPLKTDRQSGLLTPSFGQRGVGGLTYSQSYFWAMSRSQDSTWTLTNYEFRGPKFLTNYRYMLSENSFGELDLGYLRDRVFANEQRLNTFRSRSPENNQQGAAFDRYFIKYNHYYEMPEGFVHRAQINSASDVQYPNDFPLETLNSGDPAMENRMSLTKNTDHQHWSLDASYYRNMLQSDPTGNNEEAVHRLPELRFSQTQTRLGSTDFLASFDLDYVNFARSGFAYDDLRTTSTNQRILDNTCGDDPKWETNPNCQKVTDGVYNKGRDLIRTGQRLDFQPSIYRPFKTKNFEFFPKLSYRETQYTFPVGDDPHNTRRYIRADFAARTTFSRIYGDFSSLQSERIKHEIQPEISATTIPWLNHPNNDFFGQNNGEDAPFVSNTTINDADINSPSGLQYDYNDRLYDRKLFTFGVTNKFTRKSWENGLPVYLQFVHWRVAQSYDLYQAERNPNSEPLSVLTSDLKVNLNYLEIYQLSGYYPYQRVTNTSTRVRINDDKNDFFQVQHTLTYPFSPGQEADISARTEGYIFSAKKSIAWLDLLALVGYGVRPADYINKWGYGAQIRMPGDCLYFGITHYKPVDKQPDFEVTVNFTFDGNSRPSLDESTLNRFGF
jgi:LPS-assembly protein